MGVFNIFKKNTNNKQHNVTEAQIAYGVINIFKSAPTISLDNKKGGRYKTIGLSQNISFGMDGTVRIDATGEIITTIPNKYWSQMEKAILDEIRIRRLAAERATRQAAFNRLQEIASFNQRSK